MKRTVWAKEPGLSGQAASCTHRDSAIDGRVLMPAGLATGAGALRRTRAERPVGRRRGGARPPRPVRPALISEPPTSGFVQRKSVRPGSPASAPPSRVRTSRTRSHGGEHGVGHRGRSLLAARHVPPLTSLAIQGRWGVCRRMLTDKTAWHGPPGASSRASSIRPAMTPSVCGLVPKALPLCERAFRYAAWGVRDRPRPGGGAEPRTAGHRWSPEVDLI